MGLDGNYNFMGWIIHVTLGELLKNLGDWIQCLIKRIVWPYWNYGQVGRMDWMILKLNCRKFEKLSSLFDNEDYVISLELWSFWISEIQGLVFKIN